MRIYEVEMMVKAGGEVWSGTGWWDADNVREIPAGMLADRLTVEAYTGLQAARGVDHCDDCTLLAMTGDMMPLSYPYDISAERTMRGVYAKGLLSLWVWTLVPEIQIEEADFARFNEDGGNNVS